MNFPVIFKFNGVTNLSEIPEDIKTRYQWRIVTRAQLDEDSSVFLRNYPFDTSEGVTRLLSGRAARKQKVFPGKPNTQNTKTTKNNNNQPGRRTGFNPTRGGRPQTSTIPRGTPLLNHSIVKSPFHLLGTVNKRPFPMSAPPNKRFRTDLNNSFPGANRGLRPMRQYDMEPYNYNNQQPGPYNNGNNYWPPQHYPNERQQQRQEFFERSNFELHSIASDNNGHYNDRPTYPMSRPDNNFNPNPPTHFNSGRNGYNTPPSNYDRNFMHAGPQV